MAQTYNRLLYFQTLIDDNNSSSRHDYRQATPTLIAREQSFNLIGLTKLYTKEKKYSSDSDSFDYKYSIFINLYEKAELLIEAYFKAFSIILRGAALKHYYTTCKLDLK